MRNTTRKKQPDPFEIEKHLRHFCEVSSEEMGNALGTVLGELDYALSTHQPKVRERSMLIAMAAVERAIALARNLRYFSLYTRLDIHTNDLTSTLLDTVDLVEKELEFQKIQITVRAEAGLLMDFDAAAIQQVILNLMINAAQAMPEGGRLTISLCRLKDTVEIHFHDTGKGISEEALNHIFVPYRSHQASEHVRGLGLTVAKALTESHAGDIRVHSQPGKGTSFTVQLPYTGAKRGKIHTESRKYRRIRVHIPVTVTLTDGSQVKTELSILSLGGCYIRLSPNQQVMLPKVHDTLSLQIQYFGEDFITIPCAHVKNLCWAGNQSGVGLEFYELTGKAKKLIDAIVRSHSL